MRIGDLEGKPKQFVEHAGARLARIILDRDEAEIAAIARPRWTEFDRLLPKADPAVGQIGADVLRRQQQGTAFALEERREELQRFGARSEERRVGKACGSTCRSRWGPSS